MKSLVVTAILFTIAAAAAAYYERRRRKAKAAKVEVPPAPVVPEAVEPISFAGNYFFDIVPPDRNKWGEGKHPDEAAGTANTRSDWAPGLQYRLDGDGEFTRSKDGHLQGVMHVCGAECRINVAVPINGGAVGFNTDGVYAEFHFEGMKLTGVIYEPHDKENKYGAVVGRRI